VNLAAQAFEADFSHRSPDAASFLTTVLGCQAHHMFEHADGVAVLNQPIADGERLSSIIADFGTLGSPCESGRFAGMVALPA